MAAGAAVNSPADSLSVAESLVEDKDELKNAFWGLVRLFITCHLGENKELTELLQDESNRHKETIAADEAASGNIHGKQLKSTGAK